MTSRRDFTKAVGALIALPGLVPSGQSKPDMSGRIDLKIVGHDRLSGDRAAYIKAVATLQPPENGQWQGSVKCIFRDSDGRRVATVSEPVTVTHEDSEGVAVLDYAETADETSAIEAIETADFSLE